MNFLDLVNELIPGYDKLTQEEQESFKQSEAGKHIVKKVEQAAEAITEQEGLRDSIFRWWSTKEKARKEIDRIKKELPEQALTTEIKDAKEYKSIIKQIDLKVLPQIYPDIKFLSDEEQLQIANAPFSRKLQNKFSTARRRCEKLDQEIYDSLVTYSDSGGAMEERIKVNRHLETIGQKWFTKFTADEGMSVLRNKIAAKKSTQGEVSEKTEKQTKVVETTKRLGITAEVVTMQPPIVVNKNSERRNMTTEKKEQPKVEENKQQQRKLTAEEDAEQRRIALENEANKRAQNLGEFFPLLKNLTPILPTWQRLSQAYIAELRQAERNEKAPDLKKVEELFLTNLLCDHLQLKSNEFIHDSFDLREFNKYQANLLAKQILQAFNTRETIEMSKWLDNYKTKLSRLILDKLSLINGEKWQPLAINMTFSEYALSYLLQNKTIDSARQMLNNLGDAYQVLQYMGATAQNDNPFFILFDLHSIARRSSELLEIKNVFLNLLEPFKPLLLEYRDIGLYEKSPFRKIVRSLIPLLIIAAVIILVGVALAPLGVPELAFFIAAIPTLILGIYLAAKYVSLKNHLDISYHHWQWGGPFEIPEFQVNKRMKQAFNPEDNPDIDNAKEIREFYIKQIDLCDKKEADCRQKEHDLILTQKEIEDRSKNLLLKRDLTSEWFDIHSNANLGSDKAILRAIVIKRLSLTANEEYERLQKDLGGDEGILIAQEINELVNALQVSLSPVPSAGQENNRAESSTPATTSQSTNLAQTNTGTNTSVTTIASSRNRQRFFTPLDCVRKHENVEKIVTLEGKLIGPQTVVNAQTQTLSEMAEIPSAVQSVKESVYHPPIMGLM